jgi:hypothetical protein
LVHCYVLVPYDWSYKLYEVRVELFHGFGFAV